MQGEVQEENWRRKAGRLETAQQAVQVAGNQQEEEEEEEAKRQPGGRPQPAVAQGPTLS